MQQEVEQKNSDDIEIDLARVFHKVMQMLKRLWLPMLLVIAFLAMEMAGRRELHGKTDESLEVSAPEIEDVIVEEDGEVITYKGEKYRYNENITSVLCMGVDKYKSEQNDDTIGNGG